MEHQYKSIIRSKAVLLIFMLITLISCDEAFEWYLGFNKQPIYFEDSGYVSTLNVFGIIRPEADFIGTSSFVRIEKTSPSDNDTSLASDFVVSDAEVLVTELLNSDNYPFRFTETEYDIYGGRYESDDVNIQSEQIFKLTCIHDDYDTLTGVTIVPEKPTIQACSYNSQTDGMKISLASQINIYMYQAVLLFPDTLIYSDYVTPGNQTSIEIKNLNRNPESAVLYVYSFDENLANYFSSVTSSVLNLNSYRPPFKLVNGGYGVFGSMNFTKIEEIGRLINQQ